MYFPILLLFFYVFFFLYYFFYVFEWKMIDFFFFFVCFKNCKIMCNMCDQNSYVINNLDWRW